MSMPWNVTQQSFKKRNNEMGSGSVMNEPQGFPVVQVSMGARNERNTIQIRAVLVGITRYWKWNNVSRSCCWRNVRSCLGTSPLLRGMQWYRLKQIHQTPELWMDHDSSFLSFVLAFGSLHLTGLFSPIDACTPCIALILLGLLVLGKHQFQRQLVKLEFPPEWLIQD